MSDRVASRLGEFVDQRSKVLLEVDADLSSVVQKLQRLLTGGKRLRASFCYWGWRGAGGGLTQSIVDAAAALELFHVAALVHDDLMDHSDLRRGMPSAHRSFADDHQRDGLSGDSDDFGAATALLLGDLCLTWSDELLDGVAGDPTSLTQARQVYNLMRSQVIAGQYLDLLEQARPRTSDRAARTVLQYKSAKYTVEHPLLLGGKLAGASAEQLASYSAFGLPVGEAFQLRDDVLGVFGDPALTGKPAGDDFREGKKTVLVITALDRADDRQRLLLTRGLGDRELGDEQIRALQDVLVDTGARAEVEERITALVERAVAALESAAIPDDVAAALLGLAVSATKRDA